MSLERHAHFGPAIPEQGWVPAPRYALRRWRVLEHLRPLAPPYLDPVRLLEIGCGAGVLLAELAELGFACEALETSADARELAHWAHRDAPEIAVRDVPPPEWTQRFDVALAFEVLEHIEDDRAALATWRDWLRPGGRLLLSVPARMSRWGATDVYAGHYRRYERDGLRRLFEESGFDVEALECYGFPLSNLVEPLRNRAHARALRREASEAGSPSTKAEQTERSGTQRSLETRLYPLQTSWPGVALMRLGDWLQRRTLDRDWGTGYLVRARRPEPDSSESS